MKFAAITLLALLLVLSAGAEDAVIPARTFTSEALGRQVSYSTFVPEGTPPEGGWPLVLLLHGNGRNHRTIPDDAVSRARVLTQRFVIVFVDGKGGWYLDSPVEPASRYQSMLRELLDHARRTLPVSPRPERTGICGWSMGGYGAMRFAEAFPRELGVVATSIGLLDFPNPALPKEQNYRMPAVFGTNADTWPRYNCMTGVSALHGKHLFMVTGTRSFDLQMNRNFHARLNEEGIVHTYREIEGGHTFPVVQETLPMLFEFLAAHWVVDASAQ